MLFINPDSSQVLEALKEHKKTIKCRVFRKLNVFCLIKDCPTCKARTLTFTSSFSIETKVKDYLLRENNLDDLIDSKPGELKELNSNFLEEILPINEFNNLENYYLATIENKKKLYPLIYDLFHDLSKLFNYEWLSKKSLGENYSLYSLAESLNRRSCTYCNRTYTTTMVTKSNGKLMRPQFDHWYPKWKYPLLALSFYNLIPSCYTCNSSSKGRSEIDISTNIHPYIDKNQQNDFSFSYINSKMKQYHVYVRSHNTDNKALNTIKALNIDTMYNAHLPELTDLIELKKAYSDKYLDQLKKFFPNSGLSEEEIYRLAFGTEINAKDFHKRPMSKFKYDILKELGVI